MALLLAFGLASSKGRVVQIVAAVAIPILVATLYLTFGRAGWAALAVGLLVAIFVAHDRPQLIATFLCATPFAAVAIWIAHEVPVNPQATPTGAFIRLTTISLLAGSIPFVAAKLARPLRQLHLNSRVGVVFLAALLACVLVSGVFVHPLSVFRQGGDAFRGSPATADGDLSKRLISLSGSGRADYWRIAWVNYQRHPALGSGAGTYELFWNEDRPNDFGARDAHNLYLETFAELGPVGLLLLLFTLTLPFLRIASSRLKPLTAGAAGAYAAFLIHASFDWDWEMPAVALAAFLCACALLVGEEEGARFRLASGKLVGALVMIAVLFAFGVETAIGNRAVAASAQNERRGNYEAAESAAHRAIQWAPWASEPWRLLAAAELAQGRVGAARSSLRVAVRRDPNDWLGWSQLLPVTRGSERLHSLARVQTLNPRVLVPGSAP
jgi:hypothetical protein